MSRWQKVFMGILIVGFLTLWVQKVFVDNKNLIIQRMKINDMNFEIQSLKVEMGRMGNSAAKLRENVLKKDIEITRMKSLEVRVSAYTASKDECDEDPENTAIMKSPLPGRTVAVSRDLVHLLGKKVYIPGIGIRKVEDLMNERFIRSVDILVSKKTEAFAFGVIQKPLIVLD